MFDSPLTGWIAFNAFVLAMLALDLGVFHRQSHAVSFREATAWSVLWVSLALLFNLGIYLLRGPQPAMEFFTGYLIEKSLSVDNIFIFALIFSSFAVPAAYQHRVLFWGILGALVMRAAFIFAGAALLERFHWILYLFGAFLIVTGVKMAFFRNQNPDLSRNPVLRLARRWLPVTDGYHADRFWVRLPAPATGADQAGRRRWLATPLFLVLLLVESTDVVFAVDSIPAIFAITRDPFLVYTSNVFAILGLRSLYFLLAGAIDRFPYLKLGLAAVLVFVGAKMTLTDFIKVPSGVSLGVVTLLLVASVLPSLGRRPPRGRAGTAS